MLIIDSGTLSWKIVYGMQYGCDPWEFTDPMMERGALLCIDSRESVRKNTYPWYKANRKALPEATKTLLYASIEWLKQAQQRYPSNCVKWSGWEADDLCAYHFQPGNFPESLGDIVMSTDKDLLQIPDVTLVDKDKLPWSFERVNKKQKRIQIHTAEQWLVFQLLQGDVADNIPRLSPSSDRHTGRAILASPEPLRATIATYPIEEVRQRLDVLLCPSPLLTGEDALAVALRRYGYVE